MYSNRKINRIQKCWGFFSNICVKNVFKGWHRIKEFQTELPFFILKQNHAYLIHQIVLWVEQVWISMNFVLEYSYEFRITQVTYLQRVLLRGWAKSLLENFYFFYHFFFTSTTSFTSLPLGLLFLIEYLFFVYCGAGRYEACHPPQPWDFPSLGVQAWSKTHRLNWRYSSPPPGTTSRVFGRGSTWGRFPAPLLIGDGSVLTQQCLHFGRVLLRGAGQAHSLRTIR